MLNFVRDQYVSEFLFKINKNFETDSSIKIESFIFKLPNHLKTVAKLNKLSSFGTSITQPEFIEFMQYYTQGADHLNISYLEKHLNLSRDTNGMINFTNDFKYLDQKFETIYIDMLLFRLETHPFFSKYMKETFKYSLQQKLEINVFPSKENFKYDLCFDSLSVIVEINEHHHTLTKQKILDSEKTSLSKFHGNILISLNTDLVVNSIKTKNRMYADIIKNKNETFTSLLNLVKLALIHNGVVYTDLIEFMTKILCSNILKKNLYKKFNADNTIVLKESYPVLFDQVNNIAHDVVTVFMQEKLYTEIHSNVKDSIYLKNKIDEFLNTILNAALTTSFDFSQDYITKIFTENIIEEYNNVVDQIPYYIGTMDATTIEFKNLAKTKVNAYETLKDIINGFIKSSDDFIKLFNLKKKSLQNPNDTSVITFLDITKIFTSTTNLDIRDIREIINQVLNIRVIENQAITISWTQLLQVLNAYNKRPIFQSMLLLYYTHLDTIYVGVQNRIKTHASNLQCSSKDYYNYMNRCTKKDNALKLKQCDILDIIKFEVDQIGTDNKYDIFDLCNKLYVCNKFTTINQKFILDQEYNHKVKPEIIINLSDLKKLSMFDIENRVKLIDEKYMAIRINDLLTESDSDSDSESDEPAFVTV